MRILAIIIAIIGFLTPEQPVSEQGLQKQIENGKSALRKRGYQRAYTIFSQLSNDKEAPPEIQYEAHLHLGITYSMIGEYGKAMEQYAVASEISTREKLGWKKELYVMNSVAGVYYSEGNYVKSREMLRKCLARAAEEKDSTQVCSYAMNLAQVSNRINDTRSAASYLKTAHDYYPGSKDKLRTGFHTLKAEILFREHRYKEFFKESAIIMADTTMSKPDRMETILFHVKALRETGSDGEALRIATQYVQQAPIEIKPDFFAEIASICRARGDYGMAVQYLDSVAAAKERKNEAHNHKLVEENRVKMQIFEAETGMSRQIEEARHERDISILLFIIAILTLIGGAFAVYSFVNRSRQQKRLMELDIERERQEKALAETQMRETELYARYRHSILEKELQKQRHELAATSMFIASRNRLVTELLDSISRIKGVDKDPAAKGTVKHLTQLLSQGEDREKFITDFQKAHPTLMKKLATRHPNLSESDFLFLSYISMNLNNRDIASLMNISPDSAKKRRTRIGKKLELESSADLYKYLTALEQEEEQSAAVPTAD